MNGHQGPNRKSGPPEPRAGRRRPAARARQRLLGAMAAVGLVTVGLGAGPVAGATGEAADGQAATAVAPSPVAPTPVVPCPSAGTRVTLTASARLDSRCSYTGGIAITASNVVLDCRGAVVDGTGQPGVGIEVGAAADADLRDVTIRDCTVRGFLNGIRVTRVGFRGLAAGREYDHALSDVVIERTRVSGTGGVGIFVDGYVTRTTIRDTSVSDAGSAGIYLEAGSADNVVERNTVRHNGFGENGPAGQLTTLGGQQFRFWGTGREGLAIDGSRRNTVRRNRFEGNAAGSVFLYTNCGEFVHQRPERWFQRRYGADDNVLEHNSFAGGTTGVWVASRMGENTYPMDCSDPAYVEGPLARVALDRAAGNTIAHNDFRDSSYGVRVEDDRTSVVGNTFAGTDAGQWAVIIGTRLRTSVLHRPVRGTTLAGNDSTIPGNPDPYRWVHGIADTTVADNRALGRRVGICEAPELPRQAMIFVLAAALEPPGSPVTPAPDLTVPTLGALPPCAPSPK